MTTHQPTREDTMSDNAFSADEWREGFRRCTSTEDVLWKFRAVDNAVAAAHAPDALARIAELSPPKDENLRDHAEHILRVHGLLNPTPPRTVDEAGRERAVPVVMAAMREAQERGTDIPSGNRWLDRIIDALGWTAVEPEPHQCADVADDCIEPSPSFTATYGGTEPGVPAIALPTEMDGTGARIGGDQ